jgi:outer membrane protein insertion porin family
MTFSARQLKTGAAVLALCAGASLPGGLMAQDTSAQPQVVPGAGASPQTAPAVPGVIQRIRVVGNQRVERETVLAYITLQPGDAFDEQEVDTSLKTLFATGFFADVQFQQQGGDLVVQVVENPTVNQVLFEGNSAVRTEKLTEEVQIKPRAWFTQSRVAADRRRILELYRRAGRFAATVTPTIRELPQNRVDVIFEMEDGPATGIRSINILGNEAYGDNRLKEVIATQESRWYRFFSSRDNYDPNQLEYDREELRKFYLNNGYYDFRVVSANAELSPDQRDFAVTYVLDEGEQYRFGEVKVEAQLQRLNADALRAFVPIRSGQVYERDLIDTATESITFAAGAAGYAFVDVRSREEADPETNTVNLTFEVDEGPRVYVERIDIIGNGTTLDTVIRRELRLSEGDAFNQVLLDRSRQRVRGLGFFKEVEVEDRPGSQPDRAVVQVKVEEQSTGELAFGLGYSNSDAYQFDISITQRNLRGRGQFLRFRIQASSNQRSVDIRFTEPRFLGRNIAAGLEAFSFTTDLFDELGYETETTGIGLRAGFPLAEDRSLGLNYTLRRDRVLVPASFCFDTNGNPLPDADETCESVGDFTTSLGGVTFNWDTRNDPIEPTRGFSLSADQQVAGLFTGGKYARSEITGSYFYGIRPGWVASARLSMGHIAGYGGDTVRVNDRFYKGGQTFRGFEIAGLGPRRVFTTTRIDASGAVVPEVIRGEARGGNTYGILSLEMSIPTPLPESYGIKAALFLDYGALGRLDPIYRRTGTQLLVDGREAAFQTPDDFATRASAGLSVFWRSPFGPIRLDFSEPFQSKYYDRTESFRFSTAQQF